jgi:hypothetical protein
VAYVPNFHLSLPISNGLELTEFPINGSETQSQVGALALPH